MFECICLLIYLYIDLLFIYLLCMEIFLWLEQLYDWKVHGFLVLGQSLDRIATWETSETGSPYRHTKTLDAEKCNIYMFFTHTYIFL